MCFVFVFFTIDPWNSNKTNNMVIKHLHLTYLGGEIQTHKL